MMSDDDLEKISYELDDILKNLLIIYEVSPLSLAAIVVARLAHLNIAADCIEDFKKLMLDIATKDLPNPKRITKQVH